MKQLFIIFISFSIFSCHENVHNNADSKIIADIQDADNIIKQDLQNIIDTANVRGSILIYDKAKNTFYSNDFVWAEIGRLPASTFKIVHSIIALETGVIGHDRILIKWNGEKRAKEIWEQDLIFSDAFRYSCVPCYQEIARKIGEKRMNDYLKKFNYGRMQVDSNNIDRFWLEGESKISQFEQIDFLNRFYYSKLPINLRTEALVKRMMLIEQNDQFTLSGKTGWSVRNGNNNGWFVGYIEAPGNVFFFATNINPTNSFNMDMFSKIRQDITMDAFYKLGLIK